MVIQMLLFNNWYLETSHVGYLFIELGVGKLPILLLLLLFFVIMYSSIQY